MKYETYLNNTRGFYSHFTADKNFLARVELLTAETMKITVFRDVTTCSLVRNLRDVLRNVIKYLPHCAVQS